MMKYRFVLARRESIEPGDRIRLKEGGAPFVATQVQHKDGKHEFCLNDRWGADSLPRYLENWSELPETLEVEIGFWEPN